MTSQWPTSILTDSADLPFLVALKTNATKVIYYKLSA